ncbi:hypothetical protein BKA80DRAFT_286822 [Phyllosticta citrichinensis]
MRDFWSFILLCCDGFCPCFAHQFIARLAMSSGKKDSGVSFCVQRLFSSKFDTPPSSIRPLSMGLAMSSEKKDGAPSFSLRSFVQQKGENAAGKDGCVFSHAEEPRRSWCRCDLQASLSVRRSSWPTA